MIKNYFKVAWRNIKHQKAYSAINIVGLAIVIATPLAYFINNLWLQLFAYRVSVSAGILLMSIGILLFISLLTVFSQSRRAAFANPVKNLRTE